MRPKRPWKFGDLGVDISPRIGLPWCANVEKLALQVSE
jgi:hypothetical protein